MLTGDYFPYHPKPLPDELLSSWLTRIAHGHGQTLRSFCRAVWPKSEYGYCDVDNLVERNLVVTLAEKTGVEPLRVRATTLVHYEGRLMRAFSPKGDWILRGGLDSGDKRVRLQYCPRCLAEDPVPYFRRAWRLGLFCACIRHKTVLLDRCAYCHALIIPHRMADVCRCQSCFADLRLASVRAAKREVIRFHESCSAVLERRPGSLAAVMGIPSTAIFARLHASLNHFISSLLRVPAFAMESLDADERHRIFLGFLLRHALEPRGSPLLLERDC